MKKIIIADKASKSFINDLRMNNIKHEFIKGFTTILIEDTPKSKMAIRLLKERNGPNSIKII
jgi:hypothetical protein